MDGRISTFHSVTETRVSMDVRDGNPLLAADVLILFGFDATIKERGINY
jgi:hypothetical protein